MDILLIDGEGYMRERMSVEYEWKPPCCNECHVFGHTYDQCPKRVVEHVQETNVEQNDGYNTVHNRKRKGKKVDNGQSRHIEGLKLNKPKTQYVWGVNPKQKP